MKSPPSPNWGVFFFLLSLSCSSDWLISIRSVMHAFLCFGISADIATDEAVAGQPRITVRITVA